MGLKRVDQLYENTPDRSVIAFRPDNLQISVTKFEKSKKPITIHNLSDLTYIYVNPALVEILGYERSELLAQNPLELIHPDDVSRVLYRIKQDVAQNLELDKDEYRFLKKDGAYIWLQTTGVLIQGDKDDSILMFHRDISKRKEADAELRQAYENLEGSLRSACRAIDRLNQDLEVKLAQQLSSEKALDKSKQHYQTVFEHTNTALLVVDQGFSIRSANLKTENLTGYSRHEIIGRDLFELIPVPPSMSGLREDYSLYNGEDGYEILMRDKQGDIKNVILTLAPVPGHEEFVVSLRDITTIKRTEVTLKRQLEAEKLLLEVSRNFANVSSFNIDAMINLTLRMIGEFDRSDRIYIRRFSDDYTKLYNTHEWCNSGVSSASKGVKEYPVDDKSWWMNSVRTKHYIHLPRVQDLPPKAENEKVMLEAMSVKSMLIIPMYLEDTVIAYLGLEAVKSEKTWSDENITILQSVAQNIALALRRQKTNRALKASENYYRTIFHNTGAATLIVEQDESITAVNEELLALFKYSEKEVIGRKWSEFVAPEVKSQVKEYHHLRQTDQDKAPRRCPAKIIDKHGWVKDGLLSVDVIPETTRIAVTFVDLTEQRRIGQALEALSAVSMAIARAEKPEELLKKVCRYIVDIGKYSLVWGCLATEHQEKLKPLAWAGRDNGYLSKLNIDLADPKRGMGPTGKAIKTGQPVVSRNIKNDPTFKPWLKDALRRGFRSVMTIPFKYDNQIWGAMSIYTDEIDCFDRQEQKLLIEMADNIAYALSAMQAREERNRATQELSANLVKMERLLEQAVASLGNALEIRDPSAAVHQKNVARLAAAIAQQMGLSTEQIKCIAVAGNLHDVGKIYVPREILGLPRRLTDSEFAIVKTHSQASSKIIKEIEFPWPIADIILQHHERTNGSGYPRGLQGDEILIEARILAVADVVEAMSSSRPHRPALGIDAALEEIERNCGALYEPEVVKACVKVFRQKGFQFQ